jgi:hypothetical protein
MVVMIPLILIMPTVMKPIVPSMFWPIVGVFMAIVDIISSEYTPGMFSDLPLDSGMLL